MSSGFHPLSEFLKAFPEIDYLFSHLKTSRNYAQIKDPAIRDADADFDDNDSEDEDIKSETRNNISIKSYFCVGSNKKYMYWLYYANDAGYLTLLNVNIKIEDRHPIELSTRKYISYDHRFMNGIMIGANIYNEYTVVQNLGFKNYKLEYPFPKGFCYTDCEKGNRRECKCGLNEAKAETKAETKVQMPDKLNIKNQVENAKLINEICATKSVGSKSEELSVHAVNFDGNIYYWYDTADTQNSLWYDQKHTQIFYRGQLDSIHIPSGKGIKYDKENKIVYTGEFCFGHPGGTGKRYIRQSNQEIIITGTVKYYPEKKKSSYFFGEGEIIYIHGLYGPEVVFKGEIVDDLPEHGTIKYPNGTIKTGKFKNVELMVPFLIDGEIVYSNGVKFTGKMNQGFFNGIFQGTYFHPEKGEFKLTLSVNPSNTIDLGNFGTLGAVVLKSNFDGNKNNTEEHKFSGNANLDVAKGTFEFFDGIFEYGNGTSFDGKFENNKPKRGRLVQNINLKEDREEAFETIYSGEFENGLPKSKKVRWGLMNYYLITYDQVNRIYIDPECFNLRYKGELSEDVLAHGKGELFDSDIYCKGEFKNNWFVQGTIDYGDVVYEGKVKDDKIESGKYKFNNGNMLIISNLCCSLKENESKTYIDFELTSPTPIFSKLTNRRIKDLRIQGGIFEGIVSLEKGLIEPIEGTLKFRDNSYEGEFKDSKFHGKGKLKLSMLTDLITGRFENGKLVEFTKE